MEWRSATYRYRVPTSDLTIVNIASGYGPRSVFGNIAPSVLSSKSALSSTRYSIIWPLSPSSFSCTKIWHDWICKQLYPAYSNLIGKIFPRTKWRSISWYRLLPRPPEIPTTDFWPRYRIASYSPRLLNFAQRYCSHLHQLLGLLNSPTPCSRWRKRHRPDIVSKASFRCSSTRTGAATTKCIIFQLLPVGEMGPNFPVRNRNRTLNLT